MNPDRVIGTAVLVTLPGDYHRLHYLKVGRNFQHTSWDELWVLPEGMTQPAHKMPSHFPENRPWRYRIEGETLHVHPSINQGNNWWHNDGTWSVRFVRATGADRDAHLAQLAAVNTTESTESLRECLTQQRALQKRSTKKTKPRT